MELLPQIMPVEDAEIAAVARKRLEKRGIRILVDTKVTKVEKTKSGVKAEVVSKSGQVETLSAEYLISAVGVQGNIENLGLEKLGVETDRGCIKIDAQCRTNVQGHLGHRRCRRPAHAGAQGRT